MGAGEKVCRFFHGYTNSQYNYLTSHQYKIHVYTPSEALGDLTVKPQVVTAGTESDGGGILGVNMSQDQ